jgi:hypothetical protein
MGKELPYFKVYAATLLLQIHVGQEPHEVTSARLRLWCAACQPQKGDHPNCPAGYVPDDPDWLARFGGVSPPTWGAIGGAITAGWVHEPHLSRYKIKRLVEQARERADFVKFGKQGADKRWKDSPPNSDRAICPTSTSNSSSSSTATAGKKKSCPDPEDPDAPNPNGDVRRVYEHYLTARNIPATDYRLTPLRVQKIRSRLKHFTVDALCFAIDQCMASKFHQGDNDRNTPYLDLAKNIFKSHEQTEEWLNKGAGYSGKKT